MEKPDGMQLGNASGTVSNKCAVPHILGLDPGLHITGYAVIEARPERALIREAGIIRSAEGRGAADMAIRLSVLYNSLVEVLEQYQPSILAVEQLYAHYKHPRTALLMGHARGVLLLAAGQRHIPVISYNATHIKKLITGNGHASKEQMQYTMMRELQLPQLPEPPDVADALAVALCHYYENKSTR